MLHAVAACCCCAQVTVGQAGGGKLTASKSVTQRVHVVAGK
jgi:hypothetical protein